jgi:hypothetical protein
MDEFETRLRRVERENRRLRWMLVALSLGLVGVSVASPLAATAQQRDLEAQFVYAQGFSVRNGSGTIVASVSASTDGGGALTLYRPNGDPGVVIVANPDRLAVGLTGKPSYDAGVRQSPFVLEAFAPEGGPGAFQVKDAGGQVLFSVP